MSAPITDILNRLAAAGYTKETVAIHEHIEMIERAGESVAEDASKCIVELMERTDDKKKLVEVVRAQHRALDELFARLIVATKDHPSLPLFFPSESGKPWEATVAASDLLRELGESL